MKLFSKMNPFSKRGRLPEEEESAKTAEETVAFIHEQSKQRRTARMSYELQWQLNTNFLYGNQHCDVNPHRMTVENYRPVYDYLSREVFNRIAPLMETRLANLQTVRYNMTVLPRTNEYEDALKASVSTALLRAKQEASGFAEKLDSALHWCELTGSAFFLSGWDENAGDAVVICGEEETRHAAGDVAYCVLTPYEVLPEDLTLETVQGQNSILIEQVKSVGEIEDLYGVTVQGCAIPTLCYRPTAGAGGYGYEASTMCLDVAQRNESVMLYTYMERPSVSRPEGRMIIAAGSTLIFNGALPYRRIPLCQMKCQNVPGQFYGRSVIENLIPLQRSYNGIKNKINDYVNMAATGQLLVEEGSLDTDDLAGNGVAPGIPVVYARGSAKPELLPLPTLPSMVTEQCERIAADMEYTAGVSQLMVTGVAPDGITSGTAINTLQRIDNTRLSLTADNLRRAVQKLAVIWLEIYHDFGGKHRALIAKGYNDAASVIYWSDDEINSFEVVFDTENELKDSEQSRYERFRSAIDEGLFRTGDGSVPRRVLRQLRNSLGIDSFGVTLEEDLQEQNAREENLAFEKGRRIEVGPLDDHTVHLEEHRTYALQKTFRDMAAEDPRKAENMYQHIALHTKALYEEEGEMYHA